MHDGITFARGSDENNLVELFGMSDASYIPGHDRRGQLAFALFLNLNSGAVEAKSVKDSTVSTSACDIELMGMYLCLLAIIWTRVPPRGSTVLWSDSSSARQLVTDFRVGSKSQHLTIRINAINQEVNNGVIKVKYVDTQGNTVDVHYTTYTTTLKFTVSCRSDETVVAAGIKSSTIWCNQSNSITDILPTACTTG